MALVSVASEGNESPARFSCAKDTQSLICGTTAKRPFAVRVKYCSLKPDGD